MSKMGSHDPFGHSKHKLWPKEGPGVKLTIWLPTTKGWESPWFSCVQVTCQISLESSWQGLQLCFKLHFNWRFAHKVMNIPSDESFNFWEFRDSHFGVLKQNDIWVLAPWPGIENTIWVVVSLVICVCPCLSMHQNVLITQ